MDKEDYYKKSKNIGLPNRCPILNYCERRAYTIFFFSDYYKFGGMTALLKEGVLPQNYEDKKIEIQGEAPSWSKSDTLIIYNHMCPEVNLFDRANSLPFVKETASSDGEWDSLRDENKFLNQQNKHFSECTEFSWYYFENKETKIRKTQTNKRRRIGISQKLRFEIFQRDNFTCQYCGKKKEDGIKLELDHKMPISAGGTDDYNNLITSCHDCNQGKSNKVI